MCRRLRNFIEPCQQYTMKKYLLSCIILISFTPVFATQDSVIIPIYRQLFHDKIDYEQKLIDQLDGRSNGLVTLSQKPEINLAITSLMTKKINALQNFVEQNKRCNGQVNFGFLWKGYKAIGPTI